MCTLPWRPDLLLVSSSIVFHLCTEEGVSFSGPELWSPAHWSTQLLSACFYLPKFWDYRVAATPTCLSCALKI